MWSIAAKNDTTLSEFCKDYLLFLFDVPPCFATILMKNGIQRHHVEVQGRIFVSETVVSGSVTSTPTHPGNKSVLKLLRVGLPLTPRFVISQRTSRGPPSPYTVFGFTALEIDPVVGCSPAPETGSISRSDTIKQ